MSAIIDANASAIQNKTSVDDAVCAARVFVNDPSYSWLSSTAPYPAEKCLHHIFEAQAARSPNAIAIECDAELTTYSALNARANQLARYLIERGVKREDIVGICVERSSATLVAFLAVLKAGAAYLSLDPAFPREHVAYLLRDSGMTHVIGSEINLSKLDPEDVEVIPTDRLRPILERLASEDIAIQMNPDNLAFAIYTSGSTGHPKGVVGSHRVLVNSMNYSPACIKKASLSFAHAIWEMLPIFPGEQSLIVPEHVITQPKLLIDLLQTSGVSRIMLVPTLLRVIVDELKESRAQLNSLIDCFVGGEPLSQALVDDFAEVQIGTKLYNTYGASEAWDGTALEVNPGGLAVTAFMAAGRPIPNMEVLILDEHLEVQTTGAIGEVFLGGVGISRGYLGRQGLTAEKFLPHPFSGRGDRIYRTGDLGRIDTAGNLELLGRADAQVKIRGFRIELGEIENAFQQHPDVHLVAVSRHEDGENEAYLVAYVVRKQSASAGREELLQHVAGKIMSHMVPSDVIFISEMPLTTTGKINRKALPVPLRRSGTRVSQVRCLPASQTEEVLGGIWSGLLHLDEVGTSDNFFALGGSSLGAMKMLSQISKRFGVTLTMRQLLELDSLSSIAAFLDGAPRDEVSIAEAILASKDQPPSMQQEALWFLHKFADLKSSYHVVSIHRIQGRVSKDALSAALSEIERRHSSLRSRFVDVEGKLEVTTVKTESLVLQTKLMLDNEDFDAALEFFIAQEFDLENSPLVRASLLSRSQTEHVFCLVIHHLISDDWSVGRILAELSECYRAIVSHQPAKLGRPGIQYQDYAAWQRSWMKSTQYEAQLRYWKDNLQGMSPYDYLPLDRQRPAVPSFDGKELRFLVPGHIADELRKLSRREKTTLFATLLAAFKLLLLRYSGQEDIIVGTASANRPRAETHNLVGFFANTLVLRTNLKGCSSFLDALARVNSTVFAAFERQEVPYGKVVEALRAGRPDETTALVRCIFSMLNAETAELSIPGAIVTPFEVAKEGAQFDLALDVYEVDTDIRITVEYNTAVFDEATINQFVLNYRGLLLSIVEAPAAPISALSVLSGEERRNILEVWNATAAPYPGHKCIHELFEAQVARIPDATALMYERRSLTYLELNSRANSLAHRLISLGVRQDAVVAVCLERSPEALIAFLAILKAGGAYLVIEATEARRRREDILNDANAIVLITNLQMKERFGDTHRTVLTIEDLMDSLLTGGRGTENPDLSLHPEGLAYVIFTSGSTGKPKGVMVSHRAALSYLDWCLDDFRATEGAGVPAHTSMGVDLILPAFFGPLTVGGKVLILPEAPGVNALASCIHEGADYSFVSLTSSQLKLANQVISPKSVRRAIRALVFGSDALSQVDLDFWRRYAPETRLINEYGSTETVVGNCVYEFDPEHDTKGKITVGRPVKNSQIYILTREMELQGVGLPGEIFIGGENLCRGYLGRPGLTAERFVPNPFSESGGRLYRTGDLGKLNGDGNLELLGRIDSQVKFRGYRVELGEIESALSQHPCVAVAAVIRRETPTGEERLIAYIVPQASDFDSEIDFQAYLRERVSAHMVPSDVVKLQTMPLTITGKIDTKNLPIPESQRRAVKELGLAPATNDVERSLAAVWCDLLKLEAVGVSDNFFQIGGDSISSIRMVALAKNRGIGLSVRDIFYYPTISQLAAAAHLDDRKTFGEIPDNVSGTLRSLGNELTPVQRGLLSDMLIGRQGVVQFQSVYRIEGVVDRVALTSACSQLAARHGALRTSFWYHKELGVRQVSDDLVDFGPVCLDVEAEAEGTMAQAVDLFIKKDRETPFRLDQAPLMRVTLLTIDNYQHYLVLTAEHLIMDGWSLSIAARDLISLYVAAIHNASPRLASPADYSEYLRRAAVRQEASSLQNESTVGYGPLLEPLKNDVSGWREDLPKRRLLTLSLTKSLTEVARDQGVTLNTLFLTAWCITVSRFAKKANVVVGTTSSGRQIDLPGIEEMIGLLITVPLVRLTVQDDMRMLDLMQRLTLLQADSIGSERNTTQPKESKVDAVFTFQNYPDDAVKVDGWEIVPVGFNQMIGINKHQLDLKVTPGAIAELDLDVDPQSIDGKTANRVLDLMVCALEKLAADVHCTVRNANSPGLAVETAML